MNTENNAEILLQTEHFHAAQAALVQAVQAAQKREVASNTPHIVRCEVQMAASDALAWLQAQTVPEKVFWVSRGSNSVYAGIGCADKHTGITTAGLRLALGTVRSLLATQTKARYYGGARFDMERPTEQHWSSYSGFLFRLPRIELVVSNNTAILAVQGVFAATTDTVAGFESMLKAVYALRTPVEIHAPTLPALLSRDNTPNREGWEHSINTALRSFAKGETSKIALARCATFAFSNALNPLHLVRLLQQAEPRAFIFCFQLDEHRAFLGATPERLYKRHDLVLQTEAVAGTRKRGATPQEDAVLCAELLSSDKDQREHDLVREHIRTVLERHGSVAFEQQTAQIMTLPRLHHLHSPFEGHVRDGISDADILPDLHPTPAVAGLPQRDAVRAIAQIEQFDRGWYTGPIGSIGYEETEFAVAIRSGLVENNTLRLYSGAGIVSGSDAEAEWDEIEHKLGSFLALLHGKQ